MATPGAGVMDQDTDSRLPSAASWLGLFALASMPPVALLIWLALCLPVTPWNLAGLGLCLAVSAAAIILLWMRVRRALAGLQKALDERSRQRAHLKAIVDTAGDAILTYDGKSRILTANKAAARLFGHRPSALVGKPLAALLPTVSDVETNQHRLLGVAAAEEARRADGTQFPVAVSISKVRIEGQPLYLAIIHDLTSLADARRRAEESSRAKTAFLRHMSHELRTPLNGIIGMAALLRQTGLGEDQQKLLASLSQSGETLLSAVEHLLDFSRLEAGEVSLDRKPFAVREVVFEAAGPLAALARSKGVRLTCQVADDVPGQVLGDPGRLRTVLNCLVANAVKFTPGGGEVALRVALELDEGEGLYHLAFSVRDTGDGIDPTDRERIFLPFEQGPSSVGQPAGVGLGLAIASRLATLMSGTISVDSAKGQGSTFLLRLAFPAARASRDPLPVLVVMADAAERAGLQEVLHGLGLRTVGVSTGRAAMGELMRGVVQGETFGMVVVEEPLADADAAEWVGQLQKRAGWSGMVVMLKDGEARGPEPAGVAAVLDRREPSSRLGGMVARHAMAMA